MIFIAHNVKIYRLIELYNFFYTSKFGERMVLTYYPTHTRFMPWLIGIFLGFILHNCRGKQIRIPRVSRSRVESGTQFTEFFLPFTFI